MEDLNYNSNKDRTSYRNRDRTSYRNRDRTSYKKHRSRWDTNIWKETEL